MRDYASILVWEGLNLGTEGPLLRRGESGSACSDCYPEEFLPLYGFDAQRRLFVNEQQSLSVEAERKQRYMYDIEVSCYVTHVQLSQTCAPDPQLLSSLQLCLWKQLLLEELFTEATL